MKISIKLIILAYGEKILRECNAVTNHLLPHGKSRCEMCPFKIKSFYATNVSAYLCDLLIGYKFGGNNATVIKEFKDKLKKFK